MPKSPSLKWTSVLLEACCPPIISQAKRYVNLECTDVFFMFYQTEYVLMAKGFDMQAGYNWHAAWRKLEACSWHLFSARLKTVSLNLCVKLLEISDIYSWQDTIGLSGEPQGPQVCLVPVVRLFARTLSQVKQTHTHTRAIPLRAHSEIPAHPGSSVPTLLNWKPFWNQKRCWTLKRDLKHTHKAHFQGFIESG